jgi:hypothetical protein
MNDTKQKIKVGRPKGANTTVKVQLLDLLRILKPEASVVVGTLFAKELGLISTKESEEIE